MTSDSVTLLIRAIENDDEAAAHALFERYFARVTAFARRKLAADFRRVVDEEDVAIISFYDCLRRVRSGEHPPLKDRDELWWLLARITERKACDVVRKHLSARRGEGRVQGESVFIRPGSDVSDGGIASVPDPSAKHELATQLTEEIDRMINVLDDDNLRDIADLVLAGFSTAEIAELVDRTQRTVQRRLRMILDIWNQAGFGEEVPSTKRAA